MIARPSSSRLPLRAARAWLLVAVASLLLADGRRAAADVAPRSAPVAAVGPITITVSDLDRAVDFYHRVLDFELVSEATIEGDAYARLLAVGGARARVARMRLGEEEIELAHFLSPPSRPVPAGSRSNDRWFQHVAIIVGDMERAYARLVEHGVEKASVAPQRLPDWNPSAGGIRAFYFKDPDGHVLEILQFPPGKGDPRWHEPSGRLFLGIDHTALVVADSDRSLRFYRDALGLRVAGTSENHGIEQERLNAVPGAHLRITTLRAAHGPGIEMLEYVTPRDGRPAPPDLRASDLVHWRTRLATADLEAAVRALHAAGVTFVSPAPVAMPGAGDDRALALLVRDPDGHAMELVQERENRR
jgi:catechol 2,3-dioxygenase-like lactoylglutathione lyase family enzyme